ncbi:MAG: DUF3299 domain-containing protein [Saprospiraceae bacterium]|nr:DUF3299 domain-containing protein [Saprospiraceae bacterium]
MLLSAALLWVAQTPIVQQQSGWALFAKVKFKDLYFEEYGAFAAVPVFDAAIKSWQGKEISLTGYVLPQSELQDGFTGIVLSKYPYSQCFFCGMAGPESIAEVQLAGKRPKFRTDKTYAFTGKLKLNERDMAHLNFMLVGAVVDPISN